MISNELLKKTSVLSNQYYSQKVPFPDEKDKLLWLSTLPKAIAKNFEKYSLDKLMLNIPFLAFYMPKYLGNIDDYVISKLQTEEKKIYSDFLQKFNSEVN